jgi:acetyltransferase-like isoleucine patch superfamily enzyme
MNSPTSLGENTPFPKPWNYKYLLNRWLKKNSQVSLGSDVYFPIGSKVLGTPLEINDGTVINGPFVIKGSASVRIGRYCGIAENLRIISSSHYQKKLDIAGRFSRNIDTNEKPVWIGNNVWMGDNVTILPGVIIGNGVAIGAGSIVTKDIEDFSVVVGVPAKTIKQRFSKSICSALSKIGWWAWNEKHINKNSYLFQESVTSSVLKGLKEYSGQEVLEVVSKFHTSSNYFYEGWGVKENDYRWMMNNKATIALVVRDKNIHTKLMVEMYSYNRTQVVGVYLNNKVVGRIKVSNQKARYKVKIKGKLKNGTNLVTLQAEKCHRPKDVEISSMDGRNLYCCFYQGKLL